MKHAEKIGWLLDGVNNKGDTYYMRLRYCTRCRTAGGIMRLSKELDDAPVISRGKYKFVKDWQSECPGLTQ